MRKIAFLILAFSFFSFLILQKEKWQTKAADPFVKAEGRNLVLNGNLFRFIGVNRYNLATTTYPPLGCGNAFTNSDINIVFSELKQMGITGVRFWLFQDFTKGGANFTRFNYLLNTANTYGIKLIPVLENQWTDCTQGGYKYDTWYESGYLSPYGNYSLSFRDYVQKVVSTYKNNTSILMWQIMNEAESKDLQGNANPEALYNFAKDISELIKGIDSNHLVSLGTIGSEQPGTAGDLYRTLHALSTIDILGFHDYNKETETLPAYLRTRIDDSIVLNKPLIVGEAGIASNCTGAVNGFTCYSKSQRADLFRAKINAFLLENGGAGYLIWSYRNAINKPVDIFDFNASDPLSTVIKDSTKPVASPSPSVAPSPSPSPGGGDTTAPQILITFPQEGALIKKFSRVNITVSASDNIGVSKVEFRVNGKLSCTDSSSPYTCSWMPYTSGSYTITATAFDQAGNNSSDTHRVNVQ